MDRKATAVWKGGLKGGAGTLTTESGVIAQVPYSFSRRFENAPGTNPEELIAAAHSGCYAMALSGELERNGMTPENLDVTATVTLEKTDSGFGVTKSHLVLVARIPGADPEKFQAAAETTRTNCPISKLLKATITLDAKLAS